MMPKPSPQKPPMTAFVGWLNDTTMYSSGRPDTSPLTTIETVRSVRPQEGRDTAGRHVVGARSAPAGAPGTNRVLHGTVIVSGEGSDRCTGTSTVVVPLLPLAGGTAVAPGTTVGRGTRK